jgi:hypothetical protein
VDNGRLAAGAQLPHQPLSGGLPVQIGHMLGDELVTGDDVHGACLSRFDPGGRSFRGGAVHLAQVSGAPGGGTSVQGTELGTDDVWVAAFVEQQPKVGVQCSA